jgi:hypothetical protein
MTLGKLLSARTAAGGASKILGPKELKDWVIFRRTPPYRLRRSEHTEAPTRSDPIAKSACGRLI